MLRTEKAGAAGALRSGTQHCGMRRLGAAGQGLHPGSLQRGPTRTARRCRAGRTGDLCGSGVSPRGWYGPAPTAGPEGGPWQGQAGVTS